MDIEKAAHELALIYAQEKLKKAMGASTTKPEMRLREEILALADSYSDMNGYVIRRLKELGHPRASAAE